MILYDLLMSWFAVGNWAVDLWRALMLISSALWFVAGNTTNAFDRISAYVACVSSVWLFTLAGSNPVLGWSLTRLIKMAHRADNGASEVRSYRDGNETVIEVTIEKKS